MPAIAGKPATLIYSFERNGAEQALEVAHEHKLHIIAVSEDLSWFSHVHADTSESNPYVAQLTFPYNGNYYLYADYKPVGGASTYDRKSIAVQGGKDVETDGLKYEKFIDHQDGYSLTLVGARDLGYANNLPLRFTLKKGGEILDESILEDYLGAKAHIVIIGRDTKEFIHAHSLKHKDYSIYGQASLPKAGWYKMWVQYKINGKLYTSGFAMNASKPASYTETIDHLKH